MTFLLQRYDSHRCQRTTRCVRESYGFQMVIRPMIPGFIIPSVLIKARDEIKHLHENQWTHTFIELDAILSFKRRFVAALLRRENHTFVGTFKKGKFPTLSSICFLYMFTLHNLRHLSILSSAQYYLFHLKSPPLIPYNYA